MDVFHTNNDFQNAILHVLAQKPNISAKSLLQELKQSHNQDHTLQYLYRTLSTFIDAGSVMKYNQLYSLNPRWLQSLQDFSTGSLKRLRSEIVSSDDLPTKDGQRKTFITSSVAEMQPLRSRLFIAALESQKQDVYRYHAHPYWAVTNSADSGVTQGISDYAVDVCTVVGNTSLLDKHGSDVYNSRPQHRGVCSDDVPFLREGYLLEVIGDYILETIFDDEINNNVSFLFQSIQDLQEFNEEMLLHVFSMEAQVKLVVKKNSAESKRLRTILQSHFAS